MIIGIYKHLWSNFMAYLLLIKEAHSEHSQTSKMELFAKMVNCWELLTIFAKGSILLGSEYAGSATYLLLFFNQRDQTNLEGLFNPVMHKSLNTRSSFTVKTYETIRAKYQRHAKMFLLWTRWRFDQMWDAIIVSWLSLLE